MPGKQQIYVQKAQTSTANTCDRQRLFGAFCSAHLLNIVEAAALLLLLPELDVARVVGRAPKIFLIYLIRQRTGAIQELSGV